MYFYDSLKLLLKLLNNHKIILFQNIKYLNVWLCSAILAYIMCEKNQIQIDTSYVY